MWNQHDCQHHNRNHHHNRWHHRSRHPSLQSLHLCQGDVIRIITIITNIIMPGCPRIWAGGHISIGSSSTWWRQRPRSQPIIQRLTIRMSSLGGLYFIIYFGLFFHNFIRSVFRDALYRLLPEGRPQNRLLWRPPSRSKRQCQIRVRFESGVKKKFLATLNQLLTSFFQYHDLPWSHSFQKRYDMYIVKMNG